MNRPDKTGSPDPFSLLPLPRHIVAAIKAAHATGENQTPEALVHYLQSASKKISPKGVSESAYVAGLLLKRFADIRSTLTFTESFSFFENVCGSILEKNPTFLATIPIAQEPSNTNKLDPIASGVLIRIKGFTFLLTAAHVIDHLESGSLMIPGQHGFIPIAGTVASMRPPPSGRRADDKFDVGYFLLDDDCVKKLHSDCGVLNRKDVLLDSIPGRPAIYTFTGFPWRKSKVRGSIVDTELLTFSGIEAEESEYEKLGLRPEFHIAIRCNRKRAFSSSLKKTVTSPHPSGMSGGGVYAWNEEAINKRTISLPLAGIATSFLPQERLLIATRLCVFVDCIFRNRPDLTAEADS